MRNIPSAFRCFSAVFPLVEAGCEMGDRLLRRCRDGRLDAQQRLAITGRRRVKVAQKSTYGHETIRVRRLARCASPLIRAVKSGRYAFLVNQTFRKPQTPGAGPLTCVSPFHIMNKPRTLCARFRQGCSEIMQPTRRVDQPSACDCKKERAMLKLIEGSMRHSSQKKWTRCFAIEPKRFPTGLAGR